MAKFYGVKVVDQASTVTSPNAALTGITIAFGTAPVHQVSGSVNQVVAANTYEEAVDALGYSDDWDKYTLCEVMHVYFKQYGLAPLLLVNVLDPDKKKTKVAARSCAITGGKIELDGDAIAKSIEVKKGETTYEAGEDYDVMYSEGKCIIEILDGGKMTELSEVNVGYDKVDFAISSLTSDMIGGRDVSTGKKTGMELIDMAYFQTGILPNILIAPGFSKNPEVASVMAAKTEFATVFRGTCYCDIDTATATGYVAAVTAKNANSAFQNKNQVMCWPKAKSGDRIAHMSTHIAAEQCVVDLANDDIPSHVASNQPLDIDSVVLADGTEVLMDLDMANHLRENGICTGLRFINGFTAWGSYTAATDSDDPKDVMIHISRMFGYINNYIVLTFWKKVDDHITPRYAEAIVDEINSWLDNLTSNEHLYGARCELKREENRLEDLQKGIIRVHIYMAVPSLANEIDFLLEYDSNYVEAALSEILA